MKSKLRELLEAAMTADKAGDPCDSPVCPVCIWEHDHTPDQIAARMRAAFALLTREQLEEAITLLYGVSAKCFAEGSGEEISRLGLDLGSVVKYLRNQNEAFSFATMPTDEQEEGIAKH